tara:strand:- start:82 stop:735 length:654 start_codon:yes stop_codon:yes gene_type:complete
MSATKIIKGLTNFLKLSGGTMTGDLDMGDNDISEVKSLAFEDGGATITQVTDSDSLGTSDTILCTQGNVKAYVDAQDVGQLKVTKTTINEITMNSLNLFATTLIAAPGSDQIILPVFFTLLVTRDGSTAQGESAADLFISWAGATTLGQELGYIRRFMYNESGSRTYHFRGDAYGAEAYQSADPSNQALQIKLDAAITAGSITSMAVITSYYQYDNS